MKQFGTVLFITALLISTTGHADGRHSGGEFNKWKHKCIGGHLIHKNGKSMEKYGKSFRDHTRHGDRLNYRDYRNPCKKWIPKRRRPGKPRA